MDGSDDGDRNASREDESADRESGAEDRDDRTGSEGEAPADPEPATRTGEPFLDVALQPVRGVLGELIDVDTTPPDGGRTDPGSAPRSGGAAERRSSSDDADVGPSLDDVPGAEYHVESRRTDDEIVVTAELPDVAPGELFVGLDETERSLVVAVNDDVVAREFYPWREVEVASTRFDAPDLEVRLEPADEEPSE